MPTIISRNDVVWQEFCVSHDCQQTVRQIVAGETPTDEKKIDKLDEHGFIMADGSGWKVRVPLFEMWLQKYMDKLS